MDKTPYEEATSLGYGQHERAGLTFVMTCGACPETYDIFNSNNEYLGYARLRHGLLNGVDANDQTVFSANPDDSDGVFGNDEIRERYLTLVAQKLRSPGVTEATVTVVHPRRLDLTVGVSRGTASHQNWWDPMKVRLNGFQIGLADDWQAAILLLAKEVGCSGTLRVTVTSEDGKSTVFDLAVGA